MPNIYQLLVVREDATPSQCEAAFNHINYELLERIAFTKNSEYEAECLKKKAELDYAISIIRDPAKRKRYDEELYWEQNRNLLELDILYYLQDVSLAYEKVQASVKIEDIDFSKHNINAFVRYILERDNKVLDKYFRVIILNPFTLLHVNENLKEEIIDKLIKDELSYEDYIYSLNDFLVLFEHCPKQRDKWLNVLMNNHNHRNLIIISNHNTLESFLKFFKLLSPKHMESMFGSAYYNGFNFCTLLMMRDTKYFNFIEFVPTYRDDIIGHIFNTFFRGEDRFNLKNLINSLTDKSRLILFDYCSRKGTPQLWNLILVKYPDMLVDYPDQATAFVNFLLLTPLHMQGTLKYSNNLITILSRLSPAHRDTVIFHLIIKEPELFRKLFESKTSNNNFETLKEYLPATSTLKSKPREEIIGTSFDHFRHEIIQYKLEIERLLYLAITLGYCYQSDAKSTLRQLPKDIVLMISVQSVNPDILPVEISKQIASSGMQYGIQSAIEGNPVDQLNPDDKLKRDAKLALYDKINQLRDYGLTLKYKYPDKREKYESVLSLAERIKYTVDEFCGGGMSKDVASQRLNLILGAGKKEMRQHRNIIDILAHIAICLTGIGLAILSIRWAVTGKFFLNKTEREIKLHSVKNAWKRN